MRSLLLSFIIVLSSLVAFAQKGKIEGKVTDSKTGQALAGVSVINKSNQKGVSTDIDGRYIIDIDGESKISLLFSYNGVTQEVAEVEIKNGLVTTQDLSFTVKTTTETGVVVRSRSTSRRETAASLLTFQKPDKKILL